MNRQSQGYLEAATGTFLGAIVGAYVFCFVAALYASQQSDWLKVLWGTLALIGGGWSISVCGAWLALKAARCQYAGETARSIAQLMAWAIFGFFWLVPQPRNPNELGGWIALILVVIGLSARFLTLHDRQKRTQSKPRRKQKATAKQLSSIWLRRPIRHRKARSFALASLSSGDRKARSVTLASPSRGGGLSKRDFLDL